MGMVKRKVDASEDLAWVPEAFGVDFKLVWREEVARGGTVAEGVNEVVLRGLDVD